MGFDPYEHMAGGFSVNDGTIDFYLRIRSLIKKTDVVLDLGAGRAAWFEDDDCEVRRNIRLLRGAVSKLIAADVDPIVKENRASDEQILIENGALNLPSHSVDLIIADYVLEHIDDTTEFYEQVDRLLRSGGWFCARTPHKYCYVAMASALLKNHRHAQFLRHVQPDRNEIDVFPTHYKLNTLRDIKNKFAGWGDRSFVFRSDPAYYFSSEFIYRIQSALHKIMPAPLCGNLFVFMRKP